MRKLPNVSYFVSFSSVLSILVGVVGLLGCFFHLKILRTVLPGFVAISANASACFILFGLALWYLRERDRDTSASAARWLGKLAAAVAGFIGLLSLIEYSGNLNFGIDQLLFTEPAGAALGHIRPGLMSPVTALNFVLLGVALVFPNWRTRGGVWLATFLSLTAEIISALTFVELLAAPRAMHMHIALSTTVTLCILSLGVCFASLTARARSLRLRSVGGEPGGDIADLFLPETKVMLVLLLGAVFPAVLCVTISLLFGTIAHVEEPVHEGLELAGSCIALTVAMLLLLRAQHKEVPPHFIWVAAALAGMGVVDGAHAITPFGIAWSWMRHGATLLGGLLFALVWIPLPQFISRRKQTFLFSVAALSIACALFIGLWPTLLPLPWGPTGYSAWAKIADFLGGLGFLIAAVFFLRRYFHQAEAESLIFACQTLLFSTASLAFGFSHLWAATWWAWHGLRLFAYGIVLVVVYDTLLEDIRERKSAEQALRQSQVRLRLQIERMPLACILWDTNFRVVSWNPAAERIFGFKAQEAQGKHPYEFIVPKSVQGDIDIVFQRLLHGDNTAHSTNENMTADGRVITCQWTNTPLKGEDGQTTAVLSMVEDVTERKLAEEQLRRASLYSRSLLEASLDPLVTISKAGKIMDVNHATELATGITRDKLIGSDFCDYFTDSEKARRGYERVFAEEEVRDYPLAIRHASGRVMEVLYNATLFRNLAGDVEGVFAAARDITERKRSEQALLRSESRYRSLVTATSQIVWTTNALGEVVDDLPTFRDFTGMSHQETLGKGWLEALHPDDREIAAEAWSTAVRDRRHYDTQYRLRRHDGEYRLMAARGVPVFENDGTIRDWVGTCTDITERDRAEKALQAEQKRFESVLESLPVMVCLLDPDHHVVFANHSFRQAFGEAQGRKCHEYLFGNSTPCSFCEAYQVLETKASHDWECTTPNGHILHAFDMPFVDSDGSPLILEMDIDVTEQRRTERKLREQAALLGLAHDAIFVRDLDSRLLFWNRGASDLYGWTSEEALGKVSHELLHSEYPEATEAIETSVQQNRAWEGEIKHLCRDGRQVVVASRWSLLRDEKGNPQAILEINRDITERKRAQELIAAERQRFRDVLDRLPVYVVLLTPDYHVALDNTVFRERFGESHGKHCYEFLFGRDTPCEICETYSVLKNGMPQEWKWTGPDKRHYEIYDFPFADTDGSPLILEMGVDVTEREQAEEEVRRLNSELEDRVKQRTAQLEAANKELEAFTYSVSHDLRAPLRHISGFSKILSEEFAPQIPTEAQHHLQRIQDGTRRMGMLVDDLLNLARVGRRDISLQVTGLKSIAEEVVNSLKPEVSERQVEWRISDLPYVECDASLMKQVFQNLLANALKFTRPRTQAVIEVGQAEKDGVPVIFVRDNGVGFSMKYADKLFGVFQRLHRTEDFEGTGVGLATVQRIIQKHGGRIWAEAELEKGATFYFTIGNTENSEHKVEMAIAGDTP